MHFEYSGFHLSILPRHEFSCGMDQLLITAIRTRFVPLARMSKIWSVNGTRNSGYFRMRSRIFLMAARGEFYERADGTCGIWWRCEIRRHFSRQVHQCNYFTRQFKWLSHGMSNKSFIFLCIYLVWREMNNSLANLWSRWQKSISDMLSDFSQFAVFISDQSLL